VIPILRPTKIRYYLNAMQSRGFAPAKVLAGSGISVKQIRDPALLVDRRQCDTIIKNMLRLTGNPALGFEIGGDVQLTDFGILAHAMMSSPTLREAIALWVRFYNLVGVTVRVTIHEDIDSWTGVYDTMGASDPVRRFYVEETLMHGSRLGAALTGQDYVHKECRLSYPPPPYADLYGQVLKCPVYFEAAVTSSTIRSPLLDTPLRGNDKEFHEICVRHCKQIMRQISSESPVSARLRSLLLTKPSALPSLTEAAKHLGLSARSLRRYLNQEGTSYQALIDQFRLDLAKEYLKTEHLTPKEIGFMLGFRSPEAFYRAFKSWTGKTVSQVRDES
jgi:AraC-like DNA-binding protein